MENAVKPENKAWTLLKKAGRRYGLDALSADVYKRQAR